MKYYGKIAKIFAKDKNGFAIVIGMTSAKGGQLDADNMERAFQSLNFAVLKEKDISRENLLGLIEAAAEYTYLDDCPSCKAIAFYFAGHGGCNTENKKPYLKATDGQFDVEAVTSPFYPANAEQLGDIKRLFFFDMCLGKRDDLGTRDDDEPLEDAQPSIVEYALPAQGNILVAFSGTLGYRVRGDTIEGGHWTRFLHENIQKDLDIFLVLADTWNETVQYTSTLTEQRGKPMLQGPSVNACMGRLNLTAGLNVNGQAISGRNQQPSAVVHRSSSPVSATARDEPKRRRVTVDDDEEVTPHDPLMKKSPNLRDIANWLSDRAAVWRKIGVSLNVKGGMLDSIQHNVTFSDANRLTEVFEEWRRTVCSPHTFEHLIKCLEDINEVDAAKTIKEKFKDPQVIAEYSNKPDYK